MMTKTHLQERGFTLIEVMLVGLLSFVVIAGAFVALNRTHQASISSDRNLELASKARLVLDLIGRDIRTAGDSVQFLPAHCLDGHQSPGAPFGCPAIIEPHPWRLTLSRYVWEPGPDGIPFTSDDELGIQSFSDTPENVVSYQFVPRQEVSIGDDKGYLGRLERVINPFGFNSQAPEVTILLENVLLDERMAVSPDGTQTDPRRDFSLFMYRILSVASGEYSGDAAFTQRNTVQGSFILPPVRFFGFPDVGTAEAWAKNQLSFGSPPYLPTYSFEIVGLRSTANPLGGSLLTNSKGADADFRYVLDFNRIRAVDVSLKVVEAREDPFYTGGIDLDPDTPGTARIIHLQSTFELKVFSGYLH